MFCHKVRVFSGWLHFEHMPGTENPADILTKSLPLYTMRVFVEPSLFWKGKAVEGTHSRSGGE